MADSASQGLLIRAIQKYGAADLGARLRISQITLEAYVVGMTPIPDFIVLRTVDLLTEEPAAPNAPAAPASPKP